MTPWTAAHEASLSFSVSWSLLKLMSIESVMLSSHLILCRLLLLLPSIFPSTRVSSNELALHIRWQSIGASTSASVLPVNIQAFYISHSLLNPICYSCFPLICEVQTAALRCIVYPQHVFLSALYSLTWWSCLLGLVNWGPALPTQLSPPAPTLTLPTTGWLYAVTHLNSLWELVVSSSGPAVGCDDGTEALGPL